MSIPDSFVAKLKKDFTESEHYKGYDADEETGYFLNYLLELYFFGNVPQHYVGMYLDLEKLPQLLKEVRRKGCPKVEDVVLKANGVEHVFTLDEFFRRLGISGVDV